MPDPRVRRRVIGVVDSDSFVKWGAATLSRAEGWDVDLVLIETDVSATERQADIALLHTAFEDRTVPRVSLRQLVDLVRSERPDGVFVSTRGPVAEVVISELLALGTDRPVLLTGLPGISIPAKWKGVFLRAQADVFVLHSHREVAAYRELATANGIEPAFALATLPFLAPQREDVTPSPTTAAPRTRIVFAAQATVPADRGDRLRIISWLRTLAKRHQHLDVVIKVRALAGDPQTHHEHYPYDVLFGDGGPRNLRIATGSMAVHLGHAAGLVTVSSTAAIEAVALGVPVIVLDDFGVDPALINTVFEGSGLLASREELMRARFRHPDPAWLQQNYFHPAQEDDWIERAEEAFAARDLGTLAIRPRARRSRGGLLRTGWERKRALGRADTSLLGTVALVVGTPLQLARRLARRALGAQVPARRVIPSRRLEPVEPGTGGVPTHARERPAR
ncbi:hypothetical protein KXS11_13715 [Plantibacter flavus]|uniref:DUF6716 putative glycosyltransferase n=1 Tax=Plantibacter flavus TaxID=150123 RepID=UPI003F14FBC0